MTPRRVYVAGPMRGHKHCNADAFAAVTEFLRSRADTSVVNPVEEDLRHAGLDLRTLERCDNRELAGVTFDVRTTALRDVTLIADCTHIVLLPGWEKSMGATAEEAFARWIGLRVGRALQSKFGGWSVTW